MNTSPSLLGATDLLSIANGLIEAIWMAAAALPDQDQTDAIQLVCNTAKNRVSEAVEIIDAVRKGGLS
ncbi:hypothetical protein [Pseudochrobactrum sp. AO18b]|uniref:hypothetical protein n=1 Tax=Pseudochrobactrum sp. AO18b TaxID=1201036 RepID=UPI0003B4392D|nr:hypothetical protein [Pseudochrobactrum sp. AO18b]